MSGTSAGKGHPLPHSDEARHGEIPESLEQEKGEGEDKGAISAGDRPLVEPDGTPYPAADAERGQGS